ncbi:GNAT family N-acetyltransferase [Kitasatospora sp. NPDC002227]|uniref:GNAT family N-acetyltransferase n=1 Tax=Kitasatospora sp. NPDC002227 TaxID=3154773 RepID=UPI00332028EE
MADWELRPATPADVEVLAELRAVALRTDLERLGVYDEHRVRQRLRDKFEAEHTWIIEVAGAFAGCVALRPAEDAHWLEHFYLTDEHQGRGIGGAVLEHLTASAEVVRLQVLQGSAARRLYERYGFTVESEDWADVFMVRRAAWPRPARGRVSAGRPGPGAGGGVRRGSPRSRC